MNNLKLQLRCYSPNQRKRYDAVSKTKSPWQSSIKSYKAAAIFNTPELGRKLSAGVTVTLFPMIVDFGELIKYNIPIWQCRGQLALL